MKRCPTTYNIREMQIKTRYNDTALTRATIQNNDNGQMLVRMWNNRNPNSLLVGMKNGTTTLEESGNFLEN